MNVAVAAQLPPLVLSPHLAAVLLSTPLSTLHALSTANYNGTCPTSYDKPMIGEPLFEPKKACDFSIKLEEGPDFYLTSHVGGACEKNLKVYVHAVCIKNDNTFVSSLLNNLPALPSVSLARRRRFDLPTDPTAAATGPVADLQAAGYAGVLGVDASTGAAAGGIMMGAGQPTLGTTARGRRQDLAGPSSAPAVLEAAKQSAAADRRPVLASLMLVAAGVALLL